MACSSCEGIQPCGSWCALQPQSWSTLCKWNGCVGCSDCLTESPTESPTEPPTESPTEPLTESPTVSPTESPTVPRTLACADPEGDSACGETGWVTSDDACDESWAQKRCPKTCNQCALCDETSIGPWSEWTDCTATCGGGGQTRQRTHGDCTQGEFTQSKQCNLQACTYDAVQLEESGIISIDGEHNKVIENLVINTDGAAPAITVMNSENVIIRNVKITHTGYAQTGQVTPSNAGVGIFFQNASRITIQQVKTQLNRTNPEVTAETNSKCGDVYCGPFPYNMKYSYSIEGWNSIEATIKDVHLVGGSSGIWLNDCTNCLISHFKVDNVHGPYPRGQCLQIVFSEGATIEDFHCYIDNDIGYTEDMISIWQSHNANVSRGVVEGGNGPTGVGCMSELSDNVTFQDIDTVNGGGGCFSVYGADNVRFLRTRAMNNHGQNRQCDRGSGYCFDLTGEKNWCQGTNDGASVEGVQVDGVWMRFDGNGGIWYAGDYNSKIGGGYADGHKASNAKILQGTFWNMGAWRNNVNECVNISEDSWEVDGATRPEAWVLKDTKMAQFTLRAAYIPVFEASWTLP